VAFPKMAPKSKPKPTQPKFIDKAEAEALDRDIRQRISERAYALYEQSGYQQGHAEEHWRQAESDVLKREIEVRESGSWMSFSATIPETSAENVTIYVDRIRVMVRAEKNDSVTDTESREQFFVADATTELDPPTTAASLRNGKLSLMVKKRHPETAASIFSSAARNGKG
jgi:HSP20 family molecular chaperone IbpA